LPDSRRFRLALLLFLAGSLVILAVAFVPTTLFTEGGPAERAQVTVRDENGTTLATVEVRIADTPTERYRGLSDAEKLPPGEGMLFVFPQEDERAFVMREMDFALDILFVGADRRVNAIRSAPTPPPNASDLTRYRGQAKWVLEVPRGWAVRHGIEPGDRVRIETA
jgi:uncharacterized membrane protein (UPF0127 family)